MTADAQDDIFKELTEAIRKLIEEAVRNGAIPAEGFFITLTGPGRSDGPADRDQSPFCRQLTEPGIEVLDSPDTCYIIAELPGVEPGDIRFAVSDSALHLIAETPERIFKKTIRLEGVDPDSLRYTFRNGILEFSLRKITGTPASVTGNP
ncbi:MAG TPA: Hsp20/alpha crystallin family protein [Methanoculleus sp.]|nr:Hsp20/alpha crystallin family protein [Methanoculleus sp.]